jgi:hypothetical protein
VTNKGSATTARYIVDAATTLVVGDFTVGLGSGWDTTSSVAITDSTSKDQAFTVTVASAGTGQTNPALLTFSFHNGSWANVPVYICKMEGGTGTITSLTERATTGALAILFLGTPVSGDTYIISCIGMGT